MRDLLEYRSYGKAALAMGHSGKRGNGSMTGVSKLIARVQLRLDRFLSGRWTPTLLSLRDCLGRGRKGLRQQ